MHKTTPPAPHNTTRMISCSKKNPPPIANIPTIQLTCPQRSNRICSGLFHPPPAIIISFGFLFMFIRHNDCPNWTLKDAVFGGFQRYSSGLGSVSSCLPSINFCLQATHPESRAARNVTSEGAVDDVLLTRHQRVFPLVGVWPRQDEPLDVLGLQPVA